MNNPVKQSTAVTISIGPFMDGVGTLKTSLTIAQANILLSKNGGTFAQSNSTAGATYDSHGYYRIPLDTTDTNTVGLLRVMIEMSANGALPVHRDLAVLAANVYDSIIGGSANLKVDLDTIKTQSLTCAAAVTVGAYVGNATHAVAVDSNGYVTVGTNNDKTGYTASTVSDKTGYSLSQAFPANFASLAITGGGAVTAGTVSDKTGYALTQAFPTNFASLAITAGGTVTAGTVSDKTGYSLTQIFPANFASLSIDSNGHVTYANAAPPSAAAIAGAVLDEAKGTHTGWLTTLSTFESATDSVTVGALPDPAPSGYGGAISGFVLSAGTAQGAGGGTNTIQLAAGEPSTTDLYKGCFLSISSGTGAGQARAITDYNGTTKTATVSHDWAVTPSSDSQYNIFAFDFQSVSATVTGDVTLAALQPNYAPAKTGDAMTLTSAYDAAKTAAQAGNAMTLTSAYDAAKTAAQAGNAMTLTSAYDAAKTAAQAGDIPTAVQVADAVLSRNVSNAETSAPRTSLATVVLAQTNKANTIAHAGYLTVYRTNGTTEHAQIPVTTNVNAAPIDGVG